MVKIHTTILSCSVETKVLHVGGEATDMIKGRKVAKMTMTVKWRLHKEEVKKTFIEAGTFNVIFNV